MQITVKKILQDDWKRLAKQMHETVFKEQWDSDLERIDYALVTEDGENTLIQYATICEVDRDTAYIQYGGSLPKYFGTKTAYESFKEILKWLFSNYKNVRFCTQNGNWPMLKFAIKEKFYICGTRFFRGNFLIEFEKWKET